MSSPYFSIVMPTRNRGHLLRYALQSALDQTLSDYEIVVVDNCSSDDTAEVVRQVGGDRVRYLRTENALPMHENWEFALNQARGEWITFLCDDDALFPEALQKILDCISLHHPQVVSWRMGHYFVDLPSTTYPKTRRRAQIPRASGRGAFSMASRPNLAALFAKFNLDSDLLPMMLNCCCHRRVIESAMQQTGAFFLPPCPDYSSCVLMLAKTESFTCIDASLSLRGAGSHTWGVAPTTRKPTIHVDFVEDFGQRQILKHVPLSFLTVTNVIAETLLRTRDAMGADWSWLEPDWIQYFVGCYVDMTPLACRGIDITEMRREYFAALARRPLQFQTRVRSRLVAPAVRLLLQKGTVREAINRSGILRLRDAILRPRTEAVLGGHEGFDNILEAVRYASRGGGGPAVPSGDDRT